DAGVAKAISEIGYAEGAYRAVRDAATQPGRLHFCADNANVVGGFGDEDYPVPVWRNAGLRSVRVYRIYGASGRRRTQIGRGAGGGIDIQGVDQVWGEACTETSEESGDECAADSAGEG